VSAPSVNQRLTRNRRTRVVENDEYAEFFRRILRAFRRRVARGDIEALAALWGMREELDREIHAAVTGLRAERWSWAEIGKRCGFSRQAAEKRWGSG
jgi:hypothetical protein